MYWTFLIICHIKMLPVIIVLCKLSKNCNEVLTKREGWGCYVYSLLPFMALDIFLVDKGNTWFSFSEVSFLFLFYFVMSPCVHKQILQLCSSLVSEVGSLHGSSVTQSQVSSWFQQKLNFCILLRIWAQDIFKTHCSNF